MKALIRFGNSTGPGVCGLMVAPARSTLLVGTRVLIPCEVVGFSDRNALDAPARWSGPARGRQTITGNLHGARWPHRDGVVRSPSPRISVLRSAPRAADPAWRASSAPAK